MVIGFEDGHVTGRSLEMLNFDARAPSIPLLNFPFKFSVLIKSPS